MLKHTRRSGWQQKPDWLQEEDGAETIEWIAFVAVLLILLLMVAPVFNSGGSGIGGGVVAAANEYVAAWTGGDLAGQPSAGQPGAGQAQAGPGAGANPGSQAGNLPVSNPSAPQANTATGGGGAQQGSDGNDGGDGGGFWGQVGGFFQGVVVDGVWGTVTSIAGLGRDLVVMAPITGDAIDYFWPGTRQETLDQYAQLWEAIKSDPLGALYTMVEPMVTAWQDGEYGRAVGMGIFEVGMIFVPGDEVGKIGKLGKFEALLPDELAALLARIDNATPDELARLLRQRDELTPDQLAALERRMAELTPDELRIVQRRAAEALLGPDGKFADSSLEDAYQAYVQRKAGNGQTARDRADWKVERDYWLNDSPTARGNRFNTTARSTYEYNEVHLANGKRLDSYDPVAGEIISRKATDFDVIQEDTFRTYLNEIKTKYAEGTIIRSNAYRELDGQPLAGKYVLEVPASNMNAATRTRFEQIAAERGITIRYMDETTGQIVANSP